MPFASLGLVDDLARAVAARGYTMPAPFNLKRFPPSWRARLLAAAQTGTGKTAAFTLPLLQRLQTRPETRMPAGRPRALVLAPTRELAARSPTACASTAVVAPRTALVVGGVGMKPQCDALRRGVDILVARQGVCWTTWSEDRQPGRCRDSGAGRGRSDVGSGLSAGDSPPAGAICPGGGKPTVLGHLRRSDPPVGRRFPARAGGDRRGSAQRALPTWWSSRCIRWSRPTRPRCSGAC